MKVSSYLNRLGPEVYSVFLLHGVITESPWNVRNYTKKHILAVEFEELCKQLVAAGHPVTMDDVLNAWCHKEALPKNSFVLTFDDGFENNFSVVMPILEKFELPATFYVTTSFIDQSLPSWIDAIEIAIEHTTKQEISLDDISLSWTLENSREKIACLSAIRSLVKGSPQIDPLSFSASVCAKLEIDPLNHLNDSLDRKLSSDQIGEIDRHPLFLVGGHSHTHRILSYLSDSDLEQEIQLSTSTLQKLTLSKVHHYSYPEGLTHCYNSRVITHLRNYGIKICPTANDGTNCSSTDLFEIKRIAVI